MTDDTDLVRRKKLLHRARYRGFKEADLLVGGFAEEALPSMSGADMDAFEAILECSDHDLYAWIVGDAEAPKAIDAQLLARMRGFDAPERLKRDANLKSPH